MKPDLYTKTVLSVIALLLAVITWNRYTRPETNVLAQTKGLLDGVEYGGYVPHYGHYFFDKQTGEVWSLQPTQAPDPRGNYHFSRWEWTLETTITGLGQPAK